MGTARQYKGGDGRGDGQDHNDESKYKDDSVNKGCHRRIINRSSRQWESKTILPAQGESFCLLIIRDLYPAFELGEILIITYKWFYRLKHGLT